MKIFIVSAVLFFLAFTQAFALGSEEHCLALNVYHEARGQSQEDQLAVAHVTLNRVESERFPDSVCEVVTQAKKQGGKPVRNKCQFSWYCDGKSDKPKNEEAWSHAQWIADLAIRWYESGEDFSAGATHYHANTIEAWWAKHMSQTVRLDGHTFYLE